MRELARKSITAVELGFVMLFLVIIGLFRQLVYGMKKKSLTIIAWIVNSDITEASIGFALINKLLKYILMVPGAPSPVESYSATLCIYLLRFKSSYTFSLLFSICWTMRNRKMAKARKYLYSHEYFGLSISQQATTYPYSLHQYVTELVEHERTKMNYECARYLSFKSFPMDSCMTPMRLAQAGFYYTGSEQEVKCFCCGKANGEWTGDETAEDVHKRLSPNCNFIRGENTENVPFHDPEYYYDTFSSNRSVGDVSDASTGPRTLEGSEYSVTRVSRADTDMSNVVGFQNSGSSSSVLTLQTQSGLSAPVATEHARSDCASIRYPSYADPAARSVTFNNWPIKDIQDPALLVQAGFVYTGKKDLVRCFYCGGGLRDWEQGDNPWEEHARWYPSCGLVLNHFKRSEPANLPNPDMPHADPSSSNTTGGQRREIADLKLQNEKQKEQNISLQEEVKRLNGNIRCKICMDADVNIVFLPCGHMVACERCARNLEKCAVCRTIIKGSVRTYMS